MSNLGEYIARKLMESGSERVSRGEAWKCRRIEFRVSQGDGCTREQERPAGGLCESALARFITAIIDQYAIEKSGGGE